MDSFNPSLGLVKFLSQFFDVIKSILIPLRPRELELFHLLTDSNFLHKTNNGKTRIVPPSDVDMINGLGYDRKNIARVNRAFRFLKSYRICSPNNLIINPSKFGFSYLFFEYPRDFPDMIDKISDFVFWNFPFKENNAVVVCVPSGEVDRLVDVEAYYLDNWSWNLNLKNMILQEVGTIFKSLILML